MFGPFKAKKKPTLMEAFAEFKELLDLQKVPECQHDIKLVKEKTLVMGIPAVAVFRVCGKCSYRTEH